MKHIKIALFSVFPKSHWVNVVVSCRKNHLGNKKLSIKRCLRVFEFKAQQYPTHA
jgi:hypothetical protein